MYDKDITEKVIITDTKRARFHIKYNDEDVDVDAETGLSVILQYVYYRCFKTANISFDTFPMKMDKICRHNGKMVFGIPAYYCDSNIRGIEAALYQSKLGKAVFLPECIAVALDYGYVRATNKGFPTEGIVVLFCDMGVYCTTLTLIQINNNGLTVLASKYEMMGGRNFDSALSELLLQQAEGSIGDTVKRDSIVDFKLNSVAERVKKDLSAAGASDTPYTIDSLIDGDDVDGQISKEDMESICKQKGGLFDRFYHFVFETLEKHSEGINVSVVEVSGSSMRIPLLRKKLLEAVQHNGHDVKFVHNTLNMEECCSRGCCLFAEKYLVEGSIVCSPLQVKLAYGTGSDDAIVMDVCGYQQTEPVEGKFYVNSNMQLPIGIDHDWKNILKDGKRFLNSFKENSEDLHNRLQAQQRLERCHRDLQRLVNEAITNKTGLQDECEKDQEMVRDTESYMNTSRKMYTTLEYEERKKQIQDRIAFYSNRVIDKTKSIEYGGITYKGIWIDGLMTGIFNAYKDGVHLSCAEYRKGKLHGQMTQYYRSGAILATMNYVENKLDSAFKRYFENGHLEQLMNYKEGERTGYWQKYYENGQLKGEGMTEGLTPIFENQFHNNGIIHLQNLYNRKGRVHSSIVFDRDGEMTYQGLIKDGKYEGKSFLFYGTQYYAKVVFSEGELMVNEMIVPRERYCIKSLDEEYNENGKLSRGRIKWQPIVEMEVKLPQCIQRILRFEENGYVVSETRCATEFDTLLKASGGEMPEIDSEGSIHYLTKQEIIRKSLYNSKIEDYTKKEFTLFGDLLSVCHMIKTSDNEMEEVKYYPVGRNEVILNDPSKCRMKRKMMWQDDNKGTSHCIEYYNNGVKKAEGEKVDNRWVEVKRYLNTGKEKKE